MPDDPAKQGRADDIRISVQSWELAYWSRKFARSPKALRRAITQAGPMVQDVKAWLDANPNA